MKKITQLLLLIPLSLSLLAINIPDQPKPPRLVNDLANMLQPQERNAIERKLVEFNNRTSTQILVVTLSSLQGEEKSMVATEIGHKWGVGQEGFDNGIVILIKQKTATEKGEVFIAVGYGLEGVIPDAITKRIIENEIIPSFKRNNYYEGINNAVNTLMQLSLGEFSAKEYAEKTKRSEDNLPGGIIVSLLLFFFIFGNLFSRTNRMRRRSIGRNVPFWILLSMMGSGSRHGGSFGNFSSGSGGFGGGGGFSGFGGGGFGGGGAGGSW
jgi:uncharacterized protein